MIELAPWLGYCFGCNDNQQGFYTTLFSIMLKSKVGKAFASDPELSAWKSRTREKYLAKLIDYEVVVRRREGVQGKVFYSFAPQFYANISKLLRQVRGVV